MPHNAAFHQGLHCLLRQNRSAACDPSIYTMDHAENFKGNSNDTQRDMVVGKVNGVITDNSYSIKEWTYGKSIVYVKCDKKIKRANL